MRTSPLECKYEKTKLLVLTIQFPGTCCRGSPRASPSRDAPRRGSSPLSRAPLPAARRLWRRMDKVADPQDHARLAERLVRQPCRCSVQAPFSDCSKALRPARLLGCAPPCPLVLTHEARDTQHRTSLSSCRAAPVCRYATMGGCMWVVAKAALLAELGRGAAGAPAFTGTLGRAGHPAVCFSFCHCSDNHDCARISLRAGGVRCQERVLSVKLRCRGRSGQVSPMGVP